MRCVFSCINKRDRCARVRSGDHIILAIEKNKVDLKILCMTMKSTIAIGYALLSACTTSAFAPLLSTKSRAMPRFATECPEISTDPSNPKNEVAVLASG